MPGLPCCFACCVVVSSLLFGADFCFAAAAWFSFFVCAGSLLCCCLLAFLARATPPPQVNLARPSVTVASDTKNTPSANVSVNGSAGLGVGVAGADTTSGHGQMRSVVGDEHSNGYSDTSSSSGDKQAQQSGDDATAALLSKDTIGSLQGTTLVLPQYFDNIGVVRHAPAARHRGHRAAPAAK